MYIEVTAEDIQVTQEHGADNPLAHALGRLTGHPWYVADEVRNTVAYEMAEPHRYVPLDDESAGRVITYHQDGDMEPFQVEVQVGYGTSYHAGAD